MFFKVLLKNPTEGSTMKTASGRVFRKFIKLVVFLSVLKLCFLFFCVFFVVFFL